MQSKTPHIDIRIQVFPESKENLITQIGDKLIVYVRAAPQHGTANLIVRELLARHYNVPIQQVALLRGHTNHHKIIRVYGITTDAVSVSITNPNS